MQYWRSTDVKKLRRNSRLLPQSRRVLVVFKHRMYLFYLIDSWLICSISSLESLTRRLSASSSLNTIFLDFSFDAVSISAFAASTPDFVSETPAPAFAPAALTPARVSEDLTLASASSGLLSSHDHFDPSFSDLFLIHSQLRELQSLVSENLTRADKQSAQVTFEMNYWVMLLLSYKRKTSAWRRKIRKCLLSYAPPISQWVTFLAAWPSFQNFEIKSPLKFFLSARNYYQLMLIESLFNTALKKQPVRSPIDLVLRLWAKNKIHWLLTQREGKQMGGLDISSCDPVPNNRRPHMLGFPEFLMTIFRFQFLHKRGLVVSGGFCQERYLINLSWAASRDWWPQVRAFFLSFQDFSWGNIVWPLCSSVRCCWGCASPLSVFCVLVGVLAVCWEDDERYHRESFRYVQRQIDHILREFRKFARAYVDDIVVFSRSLEDHIRQDREPNCRRT